MKNTKKTLLLAGGTDGIGLAFLEKYYNNYERVFVLGRNFKRIGSKIDHTPLICDITNIDHLNDVIKKIDVKIDDFVNTIGTLHKGPVSEISPEKVEKHFQENTIANINLTNAVLPILNKTYSQMLICSASLALHAKENFALQSATKAGYKFYIDSLREEYKNSIKVMTIYPDSIQTNIFKKSGNDKDLSKYPTAENVADIMWHLLSLPKKVYIPEVRISYFNFTR